MSYREPADVDERVKPPSLWWRFQQSFFARELLPPIVIIGGMLGFVGTCVVSAASCSDAARIRADKRERAEAALKERIHVFSGNTCLWHGAIVKEEGWNPTCQCARGEFVFIASKAANSRKRCQ